MFQKGSAVLGFGLIVVWMVALGSPTADRWLAWLDALAGVTALCTAMVSSTSTPRKLKLMSAFGLASALFLLWIIGLTTGSEPWLTWVTFAFACLFVTLGAAAAREKRPPLAVAKEEFEREHLRRTGS